MHVGASLATAAKRLVGTPFKLGGADPKFGVDCVGLVYCALISINRSAARPIGYRLRNKSIKAHMQFAELNGFLPVEDRIVRGDLLLVIPGPAQHHLAIAEQDGTFVHAHAGLGKVVCAGIPDEWRTVMQWRLSALN